MITGQKCWRETFLHGIFEEISETAYSYRLDILKGDQYKTLKLSRLAIYRKPLSSPYSWNILSHLLELSSQILQFPVPQWKEENSFEFFHALPTNRVTSQSQVSDSPDSGPLAALIIWPGSEGSEAWVPYQAVYLTHVTSKIRTALVEKASHL